MRYEDMRSDLKDFYGNVETARADRFFTDCTKEIDRRYTGGLSAYGMKALQYEAITEQFDPVLFYKVPFYYETGTMWSHCDGAFRFRGHVHAGGWTYMKNEHLFREQDEELWKRKTAQMEELFYLICGPYNDTTQHFDFDYRPVFREGLKGIYERAGKALEGAKGEQKEFLETMRAGLLCIRRAGEKFAGKAAELLEKAPDAQAAENMQRIRDTAGRIPWEKPDSFYAALNTYAFLRKMLGTLEGIGPNTFGRIDKDLYPFYRADIEQGKITREEAFELICKFLIMFDCHYDHDMKMVGYADHELENTYVLGGCDDDGRPLYNELTEDFLRAAREEKIIFPKIVCRYSSDSPKEYLDQVDRAVIKGMTTVLYQNDDATIPSQIRIGRTPEEARNYVISGCWGINCIGVEKYEGGAYVNILKPFEYSLHRREDKMKYVGMHFDPIDDAQSFDQVYEITCRNIRTLLVERAEVTRRGGRIWNKVAPTPLFSATMQGCIEKKTDYTAGGAKYNDDQYLFMGFPDVVDSLCAIKELCFDSGRYTLKEMLCAIRNNWEGYEKMRAEAVRCHGFGDGSRESGEVARRLDDDLYRMLQDLKGPWGGKIHMGHLGYTEVRFWGEKTLATPNGRKNGEYICQGLTPSRLKRISSATDVFASLSCLDGEKHAANSVVNIMLSSDRLTEDICESFLRAGAKSAMQSLQLNCVTKEQLLDARKHPEKYPDLIVRVCGFSAKFTSLSPEWQQEVISRNFYD